MIAEPRYTYLRDSRNQKRVVTIARIFDKDNMCIFYGYAISNPKDGFKKSIGRLISSGRLFKNISNNKKIELEESDKENILNYILKDILYTAKDEEHSVLTIVDNYISLYNEINNEVKSCGCCVNNCDDCEY